jgi:hypothetical protein
MAESEDFFKAQEDAAHRIARICGRGSAAHQALELLEKRRAAREDSVIWRDARQWIVGPRPVDA